MKIGAKQFIDEVMAMPTQTYPPEYFYVLMDIYKAPIDFTSKPVVSHECEYEGEVIPSSEYDKRIGKQTPGVRYIVGPEYTKVLPVKPVPTGKLPFISLSPVQSSYSLKAEI